MSPGLLLHNHVAVLSFCCAAFQNIYLLDSIFFSVITVLSCSLLKLKIQSTNNNDMWLYNKHKKNCALSPVVEIVRRSNTVLRIICGWWQCYAKGSRPFVSEGDGKQNRWHLHGQLCLLSTHSEQSRDPFMVGVGVASEQPSVKKRIFESPQGTTVIHQWCVAIATW